MSNKIKHSGVVEEIRKDVLRVRILQTSACAGCKVAAHCNASESKEKIVDVRDFNAHEKYAVGDNVTVTMSPHAGVEAVCLAFIIPFVVLVAAVLIVDVTTDNEAIAAVSGICSLIPYYILLYVFKEKVNRDFVFTLET